MLPALEIQNHPQLEGPNGPGTLLLRAKEVAFLEGESGSGKTRLLRRLLDLDADTHGDVFLAGTPLAEISVRELRQRVGWLPQDLPDHRGTGRELLHRIRSFARNRDCLDETALGSWKELLELEPHLDTEIRLLSGGEKRRLSLLTVMIPCPQVLLFDEPETGLDPRRREALDRFVVRAVDEGKAILWVSHREQTAAFATAPRYRVVRRSA
jgi:ABC-type multidrug transport system ATPase subunit